MCLPGSYTRNHPGRKSAFPHSRMNDPQCLRYNWPNRQERVTTMATVPITIEVDEQTAKAYSAGSELERRRIQLLLNLYLKKLIGAPVRPLEEVIEDISAKAAARGLTPEILESILRDDE